MHIRYYITQKLGDKESIMDPITVELLVGVLKDAYTSGLERGSDTDWSFRECEIHNKAHKYLDKMLEEALAKAKVEEAEAEKCDDCPGSCK
jgi:hypothetical protein